MQKMREKAINKSGYIKFDKKYGHEVSEAARVSEEMTSAAQVDSAKDPNKSADIPATSPTLSPTLSAIVAGL